MSLADQSQQWYPTSVRVTVHQAKDLRVKGKNGTNDAYAIIQVAKDKFSTSVAEKCVSPAWKEEASFDLPLFHPGNAERCTLFIIVMHRAQVGLDKFLGQAVINLLELHDNKARKRTDWFKLVDKSGKEDKARGEVLLDIQFMRNNLSASMFDLSMEDKPRSRISKIKDKVRGKKKDSFSDSASAIVPPVSQVLTDSEGEGDSVSLRSAPGVKKKSKLKTLFAPKSNLHRNVSQSMSTLGTLPEKNSSLSSSRSSGLNIDSPDVKKKFKFLGHKRTGSSDSKISQGPFSLLGRSKQTDPNNQLCINGSHVYAEEAEAKTGSNMSLNSSGHGSVEDIRKQPFDIPVDVPGISVTAPASSQSTNRALLEQQRLQEEQQRIAEARRQEEEERRAEALRVQQEEERRLQEEQERKRRLQEDEFRRRKQREEEEMRKRQEEERRRQEDEQRRQEAAEEEQRLKQAEEQKKQEEASMTERLTSLFGMIRKKEEKKEELPVPEVKEEPPTTVFQSQATNNDIPVSLPSTTNPFEEISFGSELPRSRNEIPTEPDPKIHPPMPSAMVFLNRTAKVKPRPHPVKPLNPADSHQPSSTPAFKEIKVQDSAPTKYKVSGAPETGPYTQLTQEELITLVVKQQVDLSKKDAKIVELEEYIDNLLVRVIEEKPSILQSLEAKPT